MLFKYYSFFIIITNPKHHSQLCIIYTYIVHEKPVDINKIIIKNNRNDKILRVRIQNKLGGFR